MIRNPHAEGLALESESMPDSSEKDGSSLQNQFLSKSYFCQRVVYARELPSIMRKHTYTGAMGNIWLELTSGILFVYFGTSIGLSPFQWGLMAGISSWLISVQLLSAVFVERTGQRKLIWFCSAIAGRLLRLAGILFSLWLWQAGWGQAGMVLIVAICLSNLLLTISEPPWLSWLADIIPEEQHGTFWGRRAAWIALFVIGAAVPAGLLTDLVPPEYKLGVIVSIITAATVVGVVDLIIHGTIPEPPPVLPGRRHFFTQMLLPIRDRTFRPWLVFNICWTFSLTVGGVLAVIYFLNELGIKNNFLGGMIVLSSFSLLGSLLTGRWSGKLVDRAGIKPVLFWGSLFWAMLPLFWLLASPGTALIWLGAGSIVGGTACTAATTAANKLITRIPPPPFRATYIAVSTSLASIAGGLGVVAGGTVLRFVGDQTFTVFWYALGGFQILFLASLVLRLASLFFIRRITFQNGSQQAV